MSPIDDPGFPHGAPIGFAHGCRSRGGCLFHGSAQYLTCVEAATAHRGDFALAQHTDSMPIARAGAASAGPDAAASAGDPAPVHGTRGAYRRGCREQRDCPQWSLGRVTCAEACRRYMTIYRARRLDGRGNPIEHGTSNGYLLGCREAGRCPGSPERTCAEARAEYRREIACAKGVPARAEPVEAAAAAGQVRSSIETGMFARHIAGMTGVGRSTIADLADLSRSHRASITPATHEKILGHELAMKVR